MSELTVEQMRDEIINHCEKQTDCLQCELHNHDVCSKYNHFNAPEDILQDAYSKLYPPETVEEETPPITHDVINHPSHYCREGAMESIDEMVLLFGKEVVKHFCLCNIWKYRYRSNQKNGEEDIKKSDWYVKKYQELCE